MNRSACLGAIISLGLAAACGGAGRPHPAVPVPAGEHVGARVVPLRGVEPGGDNADLAPLRALIGDARVVALGEPAHGVHEPLAFRNRLLEYLVQELGFTAIAVESAFPDARRLADFIAGGPGTAHEVVGENRAWWPEPIGENVRLVHWLRARNTAPEAGRPVRFYAIDLGYTGPWGSRPTPAALEAALAYVRRVDPAAGRALAATLDPWLRRLADPGLVLTRPEHDALTAAIDDLVALLERERVTYLAAAPAAEYAWAHRAAVVARQADRMFRVAPAGDPNGPPPRDAWRMVNARDAAMAENVLWALEQEGPNGRVLLVAHNLHVQGAPATGGPWAAFERVPTSMGQHLRAALGNDLVIIGMGDASDAERLAAGTSLPAAAARPFLLDLRPARAEGGSARPRGAFDALLVVDSLTPAHPAPPPRL